MTITSSSSSSSISWISIVVVSYLVGVTTTTLVAVGYESLERRRKQQQQQRLQRQKEEEEEEDANEHHSAEVATWQQRRQEERTGRIRAEVKLREALSRIKQLEAAAAAAAASTTTTRGGTSTDSNAIASSEIGVNSNNNNSSSSNNNDPHALPLSTIGTVISPYPKRMGTPRQGALVPTSRGCIQFLPTLSPEAVDGVEGYSHLWIIFAFHENTSLATSKKTKIRPPRGGGIKVGQLATRSPHRPNPLGLSLVKIDWWEPSTRRLFISALDLVHGTPVYDIKPYVQWDIPPEVLTTATRELVIRALRLPSWVGNEDDVLSDVTLEPNAEEALGALIRGNKLSPLLYPSNEYDDSFIAARQTLVEILAQDPRSSHRGLVTNQRGTLSPSDEVVYRLLFGGAQVEFIVQESGAIVKNILLATTSASSSSASPDE